MAQAETADLVRAGGRGHILARKTERFVASTLIPLVSHHTPTCTEERSTIYSAAAAAGAAAGFGGGFSTSTSSSSAKLFVLTPA